MNDSPKALSEAFDVPRETIHRLTTYHDMLIAWNEKFNLISKSTIPHIWTRHFLDSAQLIDYIPKEAGSLIDMGTGAGLPGLVLAIMGVPLKIILVESTGKKVDFLKAVCDELKLDVDIKQQRIEEIKGLKADVLTARAFKPLPELLLYTKELSHKKTICLLLKGAKVEDELTQARKYWNFESSIYPSRSDSTGKILIVKDLQRKGR